MDFERLIAVFTLGSSHAMRSLLACYLALGVLVAALLCRIPSAGQRFTGDQAPAAATGSQLFL